MDIFFWLAEWNIENEKAEGQHFVKHSSDHTMLLLDTHPDQPPKKSRFIYDNRWLNSSSCIEAIQSSWNINVSSSRMYQFHRKLRNVRTGLLERKKNESFNSRKQIITLTAKMDRMCEEGEHRDWET